MAFYHGKEQRIKLIDKIIELLTTAPVGSSEPYWKKVNSGTAQNEGFVLHSSGKTGAQDIFIRLRVGANNSLIMTTVENYVPNSVGGLDGTLTNESAAAHLIYHYDTTYNAYFPVEYYVSFDRDKIIIILQGDKGVDGSTNIALAWAGMPVRLDPDGDKSNGAVSIACSKSAQAITGGGNTYTNFGRCRTIRNRKGDTNIISTMVTMGNTFGRSKGWGNEIILPDIYLQDNNNVEGIRSIMDGVHPIYHNVNRPDFKNGDEIIKNSKRYIILNVAHDGLAGNQTSFYANSFPSAWMAIEQLL